MRSSGSVTSSFLFKEQPRKIRIFRALKLGDLMCMVPAVRALRDALPDSEITLIGMPWAKEFCERFSHLFDCFMAFPGWPALPEQTVEPKAVVTFLETAQRHQFDLIVQMHGSGSHVNDAVALMGARRIAGFFKGNEWCPDPETFVTYPDQEPEIWRLLRIVTHLGAATASEQLEFPLSHNDTEEASAILRRVGVRSRFAVLHPGALATRERLWGVANFAAVEREMATPSLTDSLRTNVSPSVGRDHCRRGNPRLP
jgi:ADP-heptose:LPS heptosyltransferase